MVTTTATGFAARVAQVICDRMTTAGVTTAALAESSGIARMTLTRRLTGSSPVTAHELALIAASLNTTPSEIVNAASTGAAA